MLLNIKKAYPEIVDTITVIRFRRDISSYEFVADVSFKDDTIFYVRDYLFIDGTHKYAYHWQNKQDKLIARWDNAPHWPEIETFPHHMHTGNTIEDIVASNVRCLVDAMEEVKKQFLFGAHGAPYKSC